MKPAAHFEALDVRAAVPGDESAIVTLWRVCNLVTDYNDPEHDFHFAHGKKNSEVLVGVNAADGSIVGTVMVGHDGHRGWMYYVAAEPSNRKQGIGRRMVEAAEQWLHTRGIPKVLLLIRETNTDVAQFYTHLGFETIPRVVMQKWLINPGSPPVASSA